MFERRLSWNNLEVLQELADEAGDNWWKDVLASKQLLLALRDGYLNAYVNGQSVFRIGFDRGKPALSIHYKYLVRPDLDANPYVRFDGTSFAVKPEEIVQTAYETKLTLPRLIKAASRFSNPEKSGVHTIAQNEPRVIDLEIAFTKLDEDGEASAPRMDIAVLIRNREGGASVVFCEAKCADNKELWNLEVKRPKRKSKKADKFGPAAKAEAVKAVSDLPRQISVVSQIQKYEKFISSDSKQLAQAYVRTCKILDDIRKQRSLPRDELMTAVAREHMELTIHPRVYLLVYDFDNEMKTRLKGHLGEFDGIRSIIRGKPKDFRLAKNVEDDIKENDL